MSTSGSKVALGSLLTFSDEQAMLLETAVAFCRDKSPVASVRAQLTTETGFDPALWKEMVALGWTGIAVPERFGGSGLGLAEVATIAEPMGRHLFATPFLSTQLFTRGLVAGGSEQQCAAVLPKICDGAIGTVALFESDGDWDLHHPGCTVSLDGGVLKLSGAKTLVCDAAVADHVLLSARDSDGRPLLLLLPGAELRARCSREIVIDETQRSYRIALDGLVVPAGALIVGEGAARALDAIRDCALLLCSAQAAGGVAGALDVIVAYLNLRTTFGRKIGSYQSLKHTAAEILVELERARSHVYHAASLLGAGEEAQIALRMAKAQAGDALVHAGDRGVQFHGGFGFTYECDAQLYLRRGLWLQYAFGDSAHHRRRLAELLLPA